MVVVKVSEEDGSGFLQKETGAQMKGVMRIFLFDRFIHFICVPVLVAVVFRKIF